MRMTAIRTTGLLAGPALALALGCSNTPMVPNTTLVCNIADIPALQLLYPIPGATGVPTAAGSLVFAGAPDASLTVLLSASGTTLTLGAPVAAPSPLPSPLATPTPIASGLSSAPYPSLAPATTYRVSYELTGTTGPCAHVLVSPGSFTTQ
jgi:hypothetical protein